MNQFFNLDYKCLVPATRTHLCIVNPGKADNTCSKGPCIIRVFYQDFNFYSSFLCLKSTSPKQKLPL